MKSPRRGKRDTVSIIIVKFARDKFFDSRMSNVFFFFFFQFVNYGALRRTFFFYCVTRYLLQCRIISGLRHALFTSVAASRGDLIDGSLSNFAE